MTLLNDPTFKLYAVCVIVLCLIIQFLSGYTGAMRGKRKSPGNPEDVKLGTQDRLPEEHPDVLRVIRCHRNALENIPMFFALGLVYVLAGASATGAMVCFIGFTAARFLHVIFHLKAIQPWRSVVYGLGVLAMLGMMVLIGLKLAGV